MAGFFAKIGRIFKFGYDAVRPKGKRRAATGITRDEDSELTPEQRKKLISGARDLPRNFAVAAWAIRRHLDYVSSFTFQAKSSNPKLADRVESLMANWGHRKNCEVTQRHRLSKLIRMLECRRTVDGDVFLIKLADGRVQACEGDRVRTPSGGLPSPLKPSDLTHGVQLDEDGAAKGYVFCRRARTTDVGVSSSSIVFERLVPAENVFHHAYLERFDQVRGISPLAAAVNTFQDTYEAIDLTIAKLKVEQLFALALYRQSDEEIGEHTATAETDDDEGGSGGPGYEVDFGDGPIKLDLDIGDKAEFLQSQNPSTNAQQFIQTCIQIALKSLDIPFSFYAENYTNYSGARQALLQYQQSADIKRQDNQELLDDVTEWKIELWIADGSLAEFSAADLASLSWEWVPTGIPWIDPLKEITAQQKAIATRIDSRTRICRARGIVFRDLVDEIADEEAYMVSRGVTISSDVEVQKIETESTSMVGDAAAIDALDAEDTLPEDGKNAKAKE